jgi:phosphatidylethanolamine-binding protein (PEBP) family uncharacterized protein
MIKGVKTRKRKTRRRRQRGGGVFYGATEVKGQQLGQKGTSVKPRVSIPPNHYLVMYDPDAVKPDYIHWIAGPDGDILPYRGPTPPPGTGVHRYIFLLARGEPPAAPRVRNSQRGTALAKNVAGRAFFTVAS